MAERVDFWFDPLCPFAWVTSRWMLEVEKVRDVEVHWNVMSLGVLNEAKNPSPEEDPEQRSRWIPSRASTAVELKYGKEKLGEFYTAVGTEIHNNGNKEFESATLNALRQLGLDEELILQAKSDKNDAEMRASHEKGISLVGQDVGTPWWPPGDSLLRPGHHPDPHRGGGRPDLRRRRRPGQLPLLLRAQALPHRVPPVRLIRVRPKVPMASLLGCDRASSSRGVWFPAAGVDWHVCVGSGAFWRI